LPAVRLLRELGDLGDHLTIAGGARWSYLASFDDDPGTTLSRMSKVATSGPSLRLREQALHRLALESEGLYTKIAPEQAGPWRDFFRARLAAARSQVRFEAVWGALQSLGDDGALPELARAIHRIRLDARDQRWAICSAHALVRARADLWTSFRDALRPWDSLDQSAQAALQDDSACLQAVRASTQTHAHAAAIEGKPHR
jgi:hypothetical protein